MAGLVLLHASLLRLPYFWDEAGYYIPAARDFFLRHQLIPTLTLTNAHPPLPSIYLSLAWWVFGYSPLVTRISMLVIAAFALLAVFQIARTLQNEMVAWATVACTALYPIWFAQSSLAHADLLAACFTLWGLAAYFHRDNSRWHAILLFSLAALSKETALIFPFTLALFEQLAPRIPALRRNVNRAPRLNRSILLLVPVLPLSAWFAYHRLRTGYIFGNPEFLRYNLATTHAPVRVLIASLHRAWQLFGHMDMFVLTILAVIALVWAPVTTRQQKRPRIAFSAQLTIAALVLANWIAFSLVGGALLTRYLLPVYPLIILIFVSTLWRRWRRWPIAFAVVLLAFVAALVWNPRYRIAPEDNLTYADYIRLHQAAAEYIEHRLPHSIVLTAWPGTDELQRPWLGYLDKPVRTTQIEDFALQQIMLAEQDSAAYDAAFVFSTKYGPGNTMLSHFQFWEHANVRYFGFHQDLQPETIAKLLGGKVVWQQRRGGLWAAVIVFPRAMAG
ncbi:MAG: glycosyltransferase family 39 protein [Acidobacteriaceae bacterium]